MHEHELWLTRLFNDYLSGVANTILGWFQSARRKSRAPVAELARDGVARRRAHDGGGRHPPKRSVGG